MKWLLASLVIFVSCSRVKDEGDGRGYTVIGDKYHTGLKHVPGEVENRMFGVQKVSLSECGDLPAEFDLRTLGLVPPVKDQGQCGSCWSFSKTASLESAMLGQGKTLNLSEQELVSCDNTQWGCQGGLLSDFKYQINKGQGLETDFPYTSGNTGRDGACKQVAGAAKGIGFSYIGGAERGPTETELKCSLYKFRTVPWITVGATNGWNNPPKSEMTPYTNCSRSQTNHAVGVVGWHTIGGKTYFIMKNSWGLNWGDKGYMSMGLGCDSFGEEVAFISVATPSPTPTPPNPTPTPPGPTPTPGPCQPAHAKLPAEIQFFAGTEIMLGVKPETGVAYSWSLDGANVAGSESMIYVSPLKDSVYKITAKNACSTVESSVRVRTVLSIRQGD